MNCHRPGNTLFQKPFLETTVFPKINAGGVYFFVRSLRGGGVYFTLAFILGPAFIFS